MTCIDHLSIVEIKENVSLIVTPRCCYRGSDISIMATGSYTSIPVYENRSLFGWDKKECSVLEECQYAAACHS